MRYTERKDKSAELLRLALAEMGKHDAAFTPICFTVWYEHVAGINARLSQAIQHKLGIEPKFDDETINQLHRDHISEIDTDTAERISDQFQKVMQGISESADATGTTAGQFGAQLSGLSDALESADNSAINVLMKSALDGTAQMKAAVEALQLQVLSSHKEIDDLRNDLQRAREDATLCPLSRVLNRKGFDAKLAAMLAVPPPPGRYHCLAMLDIDHFKKVNDTHGHLMGDRVIQALGEVLKLSVTAPGACSARYGGEEFAVLLPGTTAAEALQLVELLRTRTKAMKIRNRSTNEVLLTVTVSAGVALARSSDDPANLIARADAALYRSKQEGRDRVTAA